MANIFNIRVYNLTKEELLNVDVVKASSTNEALQSTYSKWSSLYPVDTIQCAVISQRKNSIKELLKRYG